MVPYQQFGLPPQDMDFPVLEPVDILAYELHVICPQHLRQEQVHLHICKTAVDLSNETQAPRS